MQNKGALKFLAIALAIACAYQLSFTFVTRHVEKKAAEYAAGDAVKEQNYLDSIKSQTVYNLGFVKFNYKECKEKEINLGLDLRGGMNVMLEISVEDVVRALSNDSKDPAFNQALKEATEAQKNSTSDYITLFAEAYERISNGGRLSYVFNTPELREQITPNSSNADVIKVLRKSADGAIENSFNVLRNRIDRFGVTQPNIQRLENSGRILVELPGVKEPERVRKLLQGTASLEFWATYNNTEIYPLLMEANQVIKDLQDAGQIAGGDTTAREVAAVDSLASRQAVSDSTSLLSALDSLGHSAEAEDDAALAAQYPLFSKLTPVADQQGRVGDGPVIGQALSFDTATVNRYLNLPQVKALLPRDLKLMWGIKPVDVQETVFQLYAIKANTRDGKAPLDGGAVVSAHEGYAQHGSSAVVSMTMNAAGARTWARMTADNIGQCIAIVLDGYVYSAPVVNQEITGGHSEISGHFTITEARDLANVLESGKLPAPARITQDTVVGPSLGQESINSGMLSFILAFVLVLLYMIFFYNKAGTVASIALICNLFFLFGVLVSFGAVLTLPGIAGIVLTMGMAVDANVIIYERIKEELRGGKGLSLAIKDGFSKAYSAIIDGNLTTIITGIVLFIFGNGPVQGFATTLIIGIITSFFSAVFITRLLIEWIVAKWGNISFSRKWSENFLTNTHFDFIRVRKVAYTVAVALLALSCISFVARGLNLGAEFTGGRAYVIRFDKPVSAEEVRQNLGQVFAQHADADASAISFEVKQYGNENQMRIVTQYRYDDTSDEATAEVEQIIYDAMKSLYSYDISFEQFRNTQTDVNGILTADKIGPSIAKDMTWNAIYSVLFSLIAIGLYITFRFKRWQWASGATIALAVNALFIIGLFSMLYGFVPFNLEVNQAFIAAILTIIGYAINDTVVVFDRIREYLGMYPKRNLKENVNNAINSTLSRTINTSGTTLVTLLAIFFFGGETIRGFIFALTVGVIVGTVATIFIATPIAYDLMSKRAKLDKEA